LQGANLWKAQLQSASFDRAQLQDSNLAQAQLQGASMRQAELQNANLNESQLQGAALNFARLSEASFRGAQLQGVTLDYAAMDLTVLDKAQLAGASLQYASLRDASLSDANLLAADLSCALGRPKAFGGANLKDLRLATEECSFIPKADQGSTATNWDAAVRHARGDNNHYTKSLSEVLLHIICSDTVHSMDIFHGMLKNKRFQSAGQALPDLINLITSDSCLLAKKITSDDIPLLKERK
jgi:uncharacterized protein YjbI with pentapeptide repeats